MKIAVVVDRWFPDTHGGSERVAGEVSRRLATRGHEVIVYTTRAREELPAREIEAASGLRVRRIGAPRTYRLMSKTAAMMAAGFAAGGIAADADVIVTHHVWPSFGLSLRPPRDVPIVHQFHASQTLEWELAGATASERLDGEMAWARPAVFALYGRALAMAERTAVRQASTITVLSEFSRGILERVHDPTQPISVIPGGVDIERFSPASDREGVRRRLGFSSDETVLLTVRRLVKRMGIPEFVDAIAGLAQGHPRIRGVIVGAGPLRPAIEERIRAAGMDRTIELRGRVSDDELIDLYRAADLFVLPTQAYEGFGMVTLESLATGTPVVGTPAGATPEILGRLDPTLVAAGLSAHELGEAIRLTLGQDGERLRRASRTHALGYSWEGIVGRFEELCDSAIRGSAR